MKGFEVRIPFFRPLWRRFLLVGIVVAWIGVEILHGAWIWAALFAAIAAYLAWSFFVTFEDGPAGKGDRE
ncbi:MAG: DUF3329 domain-containing protein [Pseudomonadota bacterium]